MLDPRLKGEFIIETLRKDDNSRVMIVATMQEKMRTLFGNLENRNSSIVHDGVSSSDDKKTIQVRMQRRTRKFLSSQSSIDRYFNENPISYTTETESKDWVMKWWLNHQREYPALTAAAKVFLCILISTVSVERLFNTGRDMLGLRWHKLDPDSIRMLMILYHNLKQKELSQE
ncbi:hypothetical protein K3495_g4915 [Podosphaera aphanis]|nr:hypothetical protein K3495_g4915 [Podosphaera aphanis]